jgi:hypothetical protein
MILRHVWRLEFRQDRDLLDDVIYLILGVFDIDDLDRNRFSGTSIDSMRDEES